MKKLKISEEKVYEKVKTQKHTRQIMIKNTQSRSFLRLKKVLYF